MKRLAGAFAAALVIVTAAAAFAQRAGIARATPAPALSDLQKLKADNYDLKVEAFNAKIAPIVEQLQAEQRALVADFRVTLKCAPSDEFDWAKRACAPKKDDPKKP